MAKSSTPNSAGYIKVTKTIKTFEEGLAEFVQDINHLTADEYRGLAKDLAGTRQNIEFYINTISSLYNNKILLQNKKPKE